MLSVWFIQPSTYFCHTVGFSAINHIYIYIYREREGRERENSKDEKRFYSCDEIRQKIRTTHEIYLFSSERFQTSFQGVPTYCFPLHLSHHPFHLALTNGKSSWQHLCPQMNKSFCWSVNTNVSIGECHLWVHPRCPSCLTRLIWKIWEIGSKWSYRYGFIGCCFQGLLKIVHNSFLLQLFLPAFRPSGATPE